MNRSSGTSISCSLTAVAALALAGCGGGTSAASSASQPTAAASSTATATSTPSATNAIYETKYFAPSVDVAVPGWLGSKPTEDDAHFVTFASTDGSRALRLLSPVVVYPPGSSTATPVPADYVNYLLGQAEQGGHFADRADTLVDGHPAVVVTATADQALEGSLGCPSAGMKPDDCFGLQPDLSLRLAVVTLDTKPVLIWMRTAKDAELAAEASRFTDLLAGVRFSDRAPLPAPGAVAGPLDGVYTWTITKEDAKVHGTPDDQTPDGLAGYPNSFTVTLKAGQYDMEETHSTDTERGTYDATADRLVIHTQGNTLTFDITRDASGTLHLTGVPPMDPGDQFIWTTEPWTKQ